MKNLSTYKKIIALIFLSISLSSLVGACKKEGNDEPEPIKETVKLSLSVTEIAPYQFIKFQLPEGSKPENINVASVSVKIGTITAEAYPDKDLFTKGQFAYYLTVPELPAGDHKLTVNVAEGKAAEVTIKILAFTKITDPDAYIKARQTAFEQEIAAASQQYDAQVTAGKMRASTADSLKKFMQLSFTKNKTEIEGLSADEKKVYVQLVEANKSWLEEYKQVFTQNPLSNQNGLSNQNTSQSCAEYRKLADQNAGTNYGDYYDAKARECEAKQQTIRLEANSKFSAKMKEAYNAAKEDWNNTNGIVKAPKAFLSTFMREAGKGMLELAFGTEDIKNPFSPSEILGKITESSTKTIEGTVQNKMTQSTATTFDVDKEYKYSAEITLVNANRQNAASSPVFTEIVADIDNYNNSMTNLGQVLPYMPKVEVPASATEKLNIAGYTIDQISDSRIILDKKKVDNADVVKFSLNNVVVEENINFSFRINYQSEFGNVSKTVQARLHQPIEKILVRASPWKITTWIEGGVNNFSMHEIHKWKACNNVEYTSNEQLLEATYSFAAGGTGSGSEKYHEIYYESPQGACTPTKVDQIKSYSATFTWNYNSVGNTITINFKDEEGNEKTVNAAYTIQNGTITLSGGGIILGMQKK